MNCWILTALKFISEFPAVLGSVKPTAFIPYHHSTNRVHDMYL